MSSTAAVRSPIEARNNVTVLGNPTGRPMVFAHGFGCNQDVWRHVYPTFLDEYRVVLFDHVGAGNSDLSAYDFGKYDSLHGYADDVVEILEDLDLSDAVYVGHSVSAMVGILAANEAPERFGALVLIGPSPRYINDADYVGGFEDTDIRALLDELDSNYLGWSSAIAPLMMGNSDRPELGEELTGNFCSTDPTIARHFARVTFLSDNREDLPLVTTRSLVLQSREDIIAPTEVGDYVHRNIPGSQLVTLSTTGHCPNLSGPDEVIAAITSFLE